MVDAEDYESLARHRWHLTHGYVARKVPGTTSQRTRQLHREILGLDFGDARQGDHRNRCKLDNRRENLRIVTNAQNGQNVPGDRTASSRYRGVSWNTREGKWKATVRLNGRLHHLGYFASEQEAADVAAAWREEHMPFSEEAAA